MALRPSSLGLTLIVAGTAIGAGMLALPMTVSSLGLGLSFFLLVVLCATMTFTGWIQVDLHEFFNSPESISAIGRKVLGKYVSWVTQGMFFLLFYALLTAYMIGSSQILSRAISQAYQFPQWLYVIIYTLAWVPFVVVHKRFVDYANRFLFLGKVVVFTSILVLLFPQALRGWKVICTDSEFVPNTSIVFGAVSIFFTSFGFHGSLPSLFAYAGGEGNILKRAIVYGNFIALGVYGLWIALVMGLFLVHPAGINVLQSGDLGIVTATMGYFVSSSSLGAWITLLTILVITTSFLGVAMGLFDYVQEYIESYFRPSSKVVVALGTFVPALGCALFYPDGFLAALRFAAFFLSFLAVIMPCTIYLILTYRRSISHNIYKTIGCGFALIIGVGVMVCDIFQ